MRIRDSFTKIGRKVQWLVECVGGHEQKHQNIGFIGLRKMIGGLTESTLLWLFQRFLDEIVSENSVVFVIDEMLTPVKLSGTSVKVILKDCLNNLPLSISSDDYMDP